MNSTAPMKPKSPREPDRHRMDYVHCVMEISKAG